MHHEQLQKFVIIDYTKEMVILAVIEQDKRESIVGMAQYFIGREDPYRRGCLCCA